MDKYPILSNVTLTDPTGLPKKGDIREDGKMCKVAQRGYITRGKRKIPFEVVGWGNPNPDPAEHQAGINRLNDFILECAARHKAEERLARLREAEQAE